MCLQFVFFFFCSCSYPYSPKKQSKKHLYTCCDVWVNINERNALWSFWNVSYKTQSKNKLVVRVHKKKTFYTQLGRFKKKTLFPILVQLSGLRNNLTNTIHSIFFIKTMECKKGREIRCIEQQQKKLNPCSSNIFFFFTIFTRCCK